ncbi:MAG: iron-sulfur cluster repair di-iron protein [Ignavibacteriaceae bacterium]|jgi:iron-sulfur cluster repair di-iron protein|nr:MAG: iron-sulfur cluster repair di-iron protein [Chlorobiota bacterium]KXK01825.1 MAG: iron-sulfur cluster repair di-iron protein [Chlorobi bacterium OLB4]MBV6399338.1 Iron-sulfur cluster repair protein YtfE [Ignavibacteria bacterium]MCC6886783.1 iron-sulfur cluster repair di-iron protein [Ignavibacteriales bacterium]MCE7953720.1 iron-sulfur cluster repair di-iron protein [Chlorobi bacterium CHB7]MDL1887655.1 iron-sulfur cluster repair di-iron protein [Ignavibacteria bacterium CHB1]MEB2329
METLDVTKIEPRLKHPTIFDKFDALSGGEAFIIHNDHDPKPLYYQLLGERGQTFSWEYLQEGPEVWEVKLSKLGEGERPATVGELAASDIRKAEVFRKFGLDFCCGGNKTLAEACQEQGISAMEVESAMSELENTEAPASQDFNNWELDFLADYIVNTHHRYVNDTLPILNEISAKVASVHGVAHPEVVEIANLFKGVENELLSHMPKEEQILFPYIKEMVTAKRDNQAPPPAAFGSIENPIRMMEAEHTSTGDNMKKIRELSGNFVPPEDACASYTYLYNKLEEFEKDLHQHIHLENNILFPKSIKLEKESQG